MIIDLSNLWIAPLIVCAAIATAAIMVLVDKRRRPLILGGLWGWILGGLILILTFGGCSTYDLVDPSDTQEMWAASFVMARCADLGIDAIAVYSDDTYIVDGTIYGFDGPAQAAAWALSDRRVAIYRKELPGWTHENLNNIAKHECCHLKMGYSSSGCAATEELAFDCVAHTDWGGR